MTLTFLLADITCEEAPPEIPTHTEYTLSRDDGAVEVQHFVYPDLLSPLNGLHRYSTNERIRQRPVTDIGG